MSRLVHDLCLGRSGSCGACRHAASERMPGHEFRIETRGLGGPLDDERDGLVGEPSGAELTVFGMSVVRYECYNRYKSASVGSLDGRYLSNGSVK